MSRLTSGVLAALTVLGAVTLSACGASSSGPPAPSTQPNHSATQPPAEGTPPSTAPATSAFAGHWSSPTWGQNYVVVKGSTMMIVYDHDDGRVTGTIQGDTFTGWWTEASSRKPPNDAGEVQFRVLGTGSNRTIDGTWKYGTDGSVHEDWELTFVDGVIPPDIAAKFDDAATFIPHP